MKKTVITLSALVLIASSCGNKKQAGYENIPADSIQVKTETCLVLKIPNAQDFVNDESQEALSDFSFYSSETNVRFRKLGIDFITAEKRYLSFALDNGENHIIDTKEQSIFEAFLYKKGNVPISVDIVSNDWKSIAKYLQMKESEIMNRIEANEEPDYPFSEENKVAYETYTAGAYVVDQRIYIYRGTMTKETAGSDEDITFSVSFPGIKSILINSKEVDFAEINDYLFSQALTSYTYGETFYKEIEDIRKEFFGDYMKNKKETESTIPWAYDRKITIRSVTKYGEKYRIFFKGAAYAYFGGAYPETHINYFGYDLSEKRQVTLNDIVTDKKKLNEIGEKYFKESFKLTDEPYRDQGYYFDKFEFNDNFYLTDEGISFYFNKSEISCSACHIDVDIFIPYSAIKEILK
jgi:hypothetical protein